MSITAEAIVTEIGRLSVIAARVPQLEREVEQLTAERDQWRADAVRLGVYAQAERTHYDDTTTITVRVDNQLMKRAYSPREMAYELASDAVRRLVVGLGKSFGFDA